MNKKRKYLKDTSFSFQLTENIRNLYRDVTKFRKSYQGRNNLVNDENGKKLADSHNIWKRWRNYFSRLLNAQRIRDVRQMEIRTAHAIVPEARHFKCEIAIVSLNIYKLPHSGRTDSSRN
jgi:hypothetical protein